MFVLQSVSWGENLEVPPEPWGEEGDHHGNDCGNTLEGGGGGDDGTSGLISGGGFGNAGGGGSGGSTCGTFDHHGSDMDDDFLGRGEGHVGAMTKLIKHNHNDRRVLWPFSRRGRGRGAAGNSHWEDGDGGGIDYGNHYTREQGGAALSSVVERKDLYGRAASTKRASKDHKDRRWSRADLEAHPLQVCRERERERERLRETTPAPPRCTQLVFY